MSLQWLDSSMHVLQAAQHTLITLKFVDKGSLLSMNNTHGHQTLLHWLLSGLQASKLATMQDIIMSPDNLKFVPWSEGDEALTFAGSFLGPGSES